MKHTRPRSQQKYFRHLVTLCKSNKIKSKSLTCKNITIDLLYKEMTLWLRISIPLYEHKIPRETAINIKHALNTEWKRNQG